MVPGKAGKPAIVVDDSFQLWLGNMNDEELYIPPGELFGFSTGQFVQAVVRTSIAHGMSCKRTFVWSVSDVTTQETLPRSVEASHGVLQVTSTSFRPSRWRSRYAKF